MSANYTNLEYLARFTTLDKYVELSGEIYPLIQANHSGELFFFYHGKILQYEQVRDGIPLDMQVVIKDYPEYLL